MVDRSQLASAMLALAFAAVMLVAGQLFIEYRSTSTAVKPVAMKNAPLPLRNASSVAKLRTLTYSTGVVLSPLGPAQLFPVGCSRACNLFIPDKTL